MSKVEDNALLKAAEVFNIDPEQLKDVGSTTRSQHSWRG
jgi:hypothetical protein